MTRRTDRERTRGRHPARPRGPTTAPPDAPKRWPERKWLARSIRLVAFLVPVAVSFVVALFLSRRLDTPDPFVERLGRWILIALVATGVMIVVQRLTRRLLPLAALFSLTLVFPDETPSRFGLALRGLSARQLEKRLSDLGGGPDGGPDGGLGETPREAAERLLELVAALSLHDRLTRGHSERVRAYSIMIGEEMGLDAEELDRLRWAALLHDVGKLRVPEEILNKPGTLTADEYELIKLHTVAGRAMVAPLSEWLGDAANAVFEHHERFAGGGYPTGVPSEQLPLTSRIVSVADAFDVMTSARSYKEAASPRSARAELERCAGSQFDPRVVRAMMNVSLGKLWRTMGPMSWLAQVGLFPRPLAQSGTAAGAVLAALLSLLLTGIAGAAGGGGADRDLAEAAVVTTTLADSEPAIDGDAESSGGSGEGAGGGGTGDGAAPGAPTPAAGALESTTVPDSTAPTAPPDDPDGSAPLPTTTDASEPSETTTVTTTPTITTTAPRTAAATTVVAAPTTIAVAHAPPTTTATTATTATVVATTTVATTTVPLTTTTTTVPLTTTTTTVPLTTTTTTTTTTTVPTTTTTTTTTTVPVSDVLVMAAPSVGDHDAVPVLDLVSVRPPLNVDVVNHDVDRNPDPGLTLVEHVDTLDAGDPTAVQVWRFPPAVTSIDGGVLLEAWVARPSPTVAGRVDVVAGLFECDLDRTACTQLSSTTVAVASTPGSFDVQAFDITPTSLPYVVTAGRRLEVRTAVADGGAIWLAYDSVTAPSTVTLLPATAGSAGGVAPIELPGGTAPPVAPLVILLAAVTAFGGSGLLRQPLRRPARLGTDSLSLPIGN